MIGWKSMPTVLFLNPPWFPVVDGKLRRGIRGGSRWPFTLPATFAPDDFKLGSYTPYPMFMGAATAWAREALPSHTIHFRDSIARGESTETFARWLVGMSPDAVILETGASSWENDRKTLAAIKRRWPDCRVAVAGPPARSLSVSEPAGLVDAWLLGEYEKNSVRFINGQNGVIPFDLLTEEEMNSMPFPAFDEECAHHYADSNPRGATMPELQLWTSRSCTFRCSWCAWPATMTNDDPDGTKPRAFRHHSPEWVEAFILHRIDIAKKAGHPIQSIRLDDDTMNGGNKHTLAMCKVMQRIGLPWSAMCRADMITQPVWQAMKDAGCFGVKLGFESGSQRVVDEIVKKHLNLEKAAETARWLRSIGMSVHGTFTVGMPHETDEEKRQTLEFIGTLLETGAIDTYQLSGTAEIPGTPMALTANTDPNYVANSDGGLKAELFAK
jgi:radical SAM superfamily enzyme YgiQ (UPF0313 family)